MSLVHRVIILNKPLKIRGMSVKQWGFGALSVLVSFGIATLFPKEWKLFDKYPTGITVGFLFFCGSLVILNALDMKPLMWWKNVFLYRLKLVPTQYMPHPETPPSVYPDPTIVEALRKEDQFYVR